MSRDILRGVNGGVEDEHSRESEGKTLRLFVPLDVPLVHRDLGVSPAIVYRL